MAREDSGSTWSVKLISTELRLACRWPQWRLLFESLEAILEMKHRYHFAMGVHVESEYSEDSVSRM